MVLELSVRGTPGTRMQCPAGQYFGGRGGGWVGVGGGGRSPVTPVS